MEDKSDLKKGLRNLLILKAQIKGTSYLEELRNLKNEYEERKNQKNENPPEPQMPPSESK